MLTLMLYMGYIFFIVSRTTFLTCIEYKTKRTENSASISYANQFKYQLYYLASSPRLCLPKVV